MTYISTTIHIDAGDEVAVASHAENATDSVILIGDGSAAISLLGSALDRATTCDHLIEALQKIRKSNLLTASVDEGVFT